MQKLFPTKISMLTFVVSYLSYFNVIHKYLQTKTGQKVTKTSFVSN